VQVAMMTKHMIAELVQEPLLNAKLNMAECTPQCTPHYMSGVITSAVRSLKLLLEKVSLSYLPKGADYRCGGSSIY